MIFRSEFFRINNRDFNQFSTRMTRFTFNLRSASFELVELPGGDDMKKFIFSDEKMLVVKIRCCNPSVHFDHYGWCLPVIHSIGIFEEDKNVIVNLDGYARIECSHVVARVEELDPKEAKAIVFM